MSYDCETAWSDKEEIVLALAKAANCTLAETQQMLLEMARSTRSEFEIAIHMRDMAKRAAA